MERFLDLAQHFADLLEGKPLPLPGELQEVCTRTIMSRAYYGALHTVAPIMDVDISRSDEPHTTIKMKILYFCDQCLANPNKKIQDTARQLRRRWIKLYGCRILADYYADKVKFRRRGEQLGKEVGLSRVEDILEDWEGDPARSVKMARKSVEDIKLLRSACCG